MTKKIIILFLALIANCSILVFSEDRYCLLATADDSIFVKINKNNSSERRVFFGDIVRRHKRDIKGLFKKYNMNPDEESQCKGILKQYCSDEKDYFLFEMKQDWKGTIEMAFNIPVVIDKKNITVEDEWWQNYIDGITITSKKHQDIYIDKERQVVRWKMKLEDCNQLIDKEIKFNKKMIISVYKAQPDLETLISKIIEKSTYNDYNITQNTAGNGLVISPKLINEHIAPLDCDNNIINDVKCVKINGQQDETIRMEEYDYNTPVGYEIDGNKTISGEALATTPPVLKINKNPDFNLIYIALAGEEVANSNKLKTALKNIVAEINTSGGKYIAVIDMESKYIVGENQYQDLLYSLESKFQFPNLKNGYNYLIRNSKLQDYINSNRKINIHLLVTNGSYSNHISYGNTLIDFINHFGKGCKTVLYGNFVFQNKKSGIIYKDNYF